MQLNSALLLTLAALPLVLLLFAWRAWKAHDRQIVNGSRRTLFWGGASATVISLLLYIGFALASGVHALPSHCTTEPERKPVPFTVKVKPGPPAVTELGLTDVMEGGRTGVGVGVGFGVPPPPPPQPVNKNALTNDKDRTTAFSLFLLLSHIVCSRDSSA